MNSHLIWDGRMGFTATGDSGHQVSIDVSKEVGGLDSAARPMELVLHGLGGCSGADVAAILKKMRIDVKRFTIDITAERALVDPKSYTDIHMIYRLSGPEIDPEKAKHAIELSQTKYCSVVASLNAKITYELVIEEKF